MPKLYPITLYRSILKAHKKFLPTEMRKLGDTYVKNEFKQHKDTTNPEYLRQFFMGWSQYLEILQKKNQGSKIGISLDRSFNEVLNEDQKEKLKQLQDEIFDKSKDQKSNN